MAEMAPERRASLVHRLQEMSLLAAHKLDHPKVNLFVLAALLALDVPARILNACAKPFWYDELFSVYLSRLPSMKDLIQALSAGADAMPAGYLALEKLSGQLPLDPHVAFRLPSILGYLAATAGVYFFARRVFYPATALAAACLLALSPFREYAIEARPYGVLVGSIALAAALWQRADDKRRYVVLLAACLMAMVACHHYGVVVLACFGVAETAWLVVRRRWRWSVWLAFAAATIPFWAGLPLLLRFRELAAANYWARPDWASIPSTYLLSGVSLAYWAALTLAAVLATARMAARWSSNASVGSRGGISLPEAVLAWSLLLFPVLLVALTALAKGGYFVRYGWPFIVGFTMLCGLGMEFLIHKRRMAWVALALAASFFVRSALEMARYRAADARERGGAPLRAFQTVLGDLQSHLPVVVANPMEHLPLMYYARQEERERLITLTGLKASLQYSGTDSVALSVLSLDRFIPLRVGDPEKFLAQHANFYLWEPSGQPDWILTYLTDQGASLRLLPVRGAGLIYLVERGR